MSYVRHNTTDRELWAMSHSSMMPQATNTFQPISHRYMKETAERAIEAVGYRIADSKVEVFGQNNCKAVGEILLAPLGDERNDIYHVMMGWKNSWDKSSSATLGIGTKVTICSNGIFSAERMVGRKHTSNIYADLYDKMYDAVYAYQGHVAKEKQRLELYRSTPLVEAQVNKVIIDCLDVGALTGCQIPKVLTEYRTPSYEAHNHNGNDCFRLLNAITQTLKEVNPVTRGKRGQLVIPVLDAVIA